MKVKPINTEIFKAKQNLADFLTANIRSLEEASVVVVTSKIVALAEGRTKPVSSAKEKELLVKSESQYATFVEPVWLTVKDGQFMANAGIDDSNGNGCLTLLPSDSFNSAKTIRQVLLKHFRVKKLGVLITDSRFVPLRAGALGAAVGYAGFRGLRDYRGQSDIFGRKFVFETMNIADALATAAVLAMGEGAERRPLAILEGAELEFVDKTDHNELKINPAVDIYRPLLSFKLK